MMGNLQLKIVALDYGNPESGVSKKIIYQAQAFDNNGINAELVLLGKGDPKSFRYSKVTIVPTKTPPYTSLMDKLAALASLRKSYEKVLLEGDSNEIIFLRNYVPAGWLYRAIKKSKKRIVLELLANNFEEALLRKSYLYYISLCLNHKRVLKNVDLIVSVTKEILDQHFNTEKHKVPYMIIGNGIQVESVPLRQRKEPTLPREYNLTCVALVSPWHGLDRLLKGLKNYTGNDIINFHIVGAGSEIQNLKDMTESLGLKNVFFHGFLGGSKLDDILDKTDLAISTLAIHRTKILYQSVLKSREYCARGIPFIYGGIDDDFPDDFPFALKLESCEEPIDMNSVIDFLRNVTTIPDYNTKMRQYAFDVLSWNVKMKKLSEYLRK